MTVFYNILGNNLVANVTNFTVWFAITFWVFIETQSVFATGMIAGIYLIGPDGTPYRVGFSLANEFSDHVTERINYLFLAHSKLRPAAFGPELLIGDLPADIRGTSRIFRNGKVLWEKPFLSGEANMSHTFANLEHHHFKYGLFCQPGDVHIHMFGTATLSFADKIKPEAGDVFEISAPDFGLALSNPLAVEKPASGAVKVRSL